MPIQLLRTSFSVPLLVLLGSLVGGCSSGSDSSRNPTGDDDGPPPEMVSIPCGAGPGGGYQLLGPASSYAWSIIGVAAGIAGVGTPTGGAYEVTPTIAWYYPGPDEIHYDPFNLSNFNNQLGGAEPGDSILYHEVGHMWASKTGRAGCIGSATVQERWNQEFQADSFAGAVLSSLGGQWLPSVVIYQTVLGGWSASHPPGAQRAEVFMDGYLAGTRDYCSGGLSAWSGSGIRAVDRPAVETLAALHRVRRQLQREGYNPYSSESDERFHELLTAELRTAVEALPANPARITQAVLPGPGGR